MLWVLGNICDPYRDKVSGQCMICEGENHNMYRSVTSIRLMKSGKLWWAGYTAKLGRQEMST
jgi:hypothetical protein